MALVSVCLLSAVIVAPTFVHIPLVQSLLTHKSIDVSAQNCVHYKQGAYTGELSADILRDCGLNWVILGHSERRQLFHTDDETVGKQVAAALANGLKVIACVGETLQEREANETTKVIERQMKAIAANVSDWSKVVIAYEPVWAIGTGSDSEAHGTSGRRGSSTAQPWSGDRQAAADRPPSSDPRPLSASRLASPRLASPPPLLSS